MKNNRFRRSWAETKLYIRENYRILILIFILGMLLGAIIGSALEQGRLVSTHQLSEAHYLNIISILYYGYGSANSRAISIVIGLVVAFGVGYYKVYIDTMDLMYDERGFMISPNGTYGTSRVMTETEKRANGFLKRIEVNETNEDIIGKYDDGTVEIVNNKKGIGPHVLVSGASGSGKTVSIFFNKFFQCIQRGESIIATDPKGELRQMMKKLCEKHGYVVKEFNLITPFVSDSINLLDLVENMQDARSFTEIILSNTEGGNIRNEDFWLKGERAAICFGILYVKEAPEFEGKRTLAEVYKFLLNPIDIIQAKVATVPGSLAEKQWRIFLTTPEQSQGGIMTGVATRLQALNDDVLQQITGNKDIDITLPGKQKCIYFVLMSDNDDSNNFIASIFFSFLFMKLMQYADTQTVEGRLPVPVNMLLEEFPNIGKINRFPQLLSVIRSRGISCTICTQDVGQLQDMYPGKKYTNIIGNCDTKICLGVNETETAKYWSSCCGTMTIIVETTRENARRFRPYTINSFYTKNVGEGRRAVFMEDEILHLDNEYMLVFFRGHNVMKIQKFPYYEHPMYDEIEKEKYIQHRPLWWKMVEKKIYEINQIGGDLREYQWFADAAQKFASQAEELNQKMETENNKRLVRDKNLIKSVEVNREISKGDNKKAKRKDFIKYYYIQGKRLKVKIHDYLHNVSGIKGDVDVDEEMISHFEKMEDKDLRIDFAVDEGFEDAYVDNEDSVYIANAFEEIKKVQNKYRKANDTEYEKTKENDIGNPGEADIKGQSKPIDTGKDIEELDNVNIKGQSKTNKKIYDNIDKVFQENKDAVEKRKKQKEKDERPYAKQNSSLRDNVMGILENEKSYDSESYEDETYMKEVNTFNVTDCLNDEIDVGALLNTFDNNREQQERHKEMIRSQYQERI